MVKVVAGVDIGGTGTKFGLVDPNGEVLSESKMPTAVGGTFECFVEKLAEEIQMMLADTGFELEGIGIGAPSGNYYTGNISGASNLPWKGDLPMVDEMLKHFEVPIVLSNDANATAMGEMVFGGAKGMRDFVMITLGTGLGSGIVSGGQLIIGSQSMAAELGHVLVHSDGKGRACNCGRKGCLETYASATGIKKTMIELLESSREESLLRNVPINEISSRMIASAAQKGDKLALEAFDYTGRLLGVQLANIVSVMNPEAIFLFGGLSLSGDLIFDTTRKYMEQNLLSIYKGSVKLLPSQLGAQGAAIVGAASLAHQQKDYLHFEIS
ncbi:ROK family protein [Reichenbachiella ulvae]|uniref:ROK family protein n=1 Tax=Reichenbachiella ulvae TaxID=2980104 RepID=A0ABT3CTQ2_9BACT|nr:ROK family protein [Reichenbachiella ulvae]MCV9387081.1 ROK family protein [Reichenbachiella ulvae]